MSELPNFRGKVFSRDASEAYRVHAYQYATTSEAEGTMTPAVIVYVADDDDIVVAIQYARENDLGIAVRSGGHQYLGASSTTGRNIQIDLSGREAPDPAAYPYRQWSIDEAEGSITLGSGLDLDAVNPITSKYGIFFPHGECCAVHVGGHSQTGGWSVITRTYGVMIDYLIRFDIILADGTKRTVRRDSEEQLDKDLWFAVLGGSPGNLGVVTRITVKYLRDTDHPKSRGFKMAWPLTKDTLQQLLELINVINDDPSIDPDFNLTVIALGEEHDPGVPSILPETFDDFMIKNYPNLAGTDQFHWILPNISVVGTWANSKGRDQDDSHVDAVFARFRAVPGMLPLDLMQQVFGQKTMMDGSVTTPMSAIIQNLTFENPREFALSCRKLLWFGKNTSTMSQKTPLGGTFAEWLATKFHEMESVWGFFAYFGMKAAMQIGLVGGPGLANAPVRTAMGQRDGNYWFAFDIFYDPKIDGAREKTLAFTNALAADVVGNRVNLFEDGKERRLILGPMLIDDERPILDEQWALYYDSRDVYDRLLAIKKRVDPNHVFTANLFCVGATTCPRFAK